MSHAYQSQMVRKRRREKKAQRFIEQNPEFIKFFTEAVINRFCKGIAQLASAIQEARRQNP